MAPGVRSALCGGDRIEEAPYVRLTTNIVGCPPELVEIGQPVQVRFEQVDDVWLPLFEPRGA
jgi:hypothetical protein